MPFVRQQPGKKPGDQQREQVEQTSGLQRESGLIGSTGGSLHEGMQRPTAPTPAPAAPQPRSRALNLSDYAAANIDKTRALAQQTASRVAGGARRAQESLGRAQQEFGGLVNQGPTLGEGLAETQRIQQKALNVNTTPTTPYKPAETGRTVLSDTQRQSDAFSEGQRFLKSLPPTTPTRQTNLPQGPNNLPTVDTTEEIITPAQQPIAGTAEGTLTEQDIRRYHQLTGGYQGPQALGDVDANLASQLGAASQEGQLAQTTAGQRGLLQQQLGQEGGYSQGAGTLDAALVGAQSGGIRQAGQAAAGVGQRGLEASTQAAQQAGTRAADLQKLSQQAGQSLQQQVGDIEQDISQQTTQAQEQAASNKAIIDSIGLRNPDVKKYSDEVNKAGEQLGALDMSLATKGLSPELQRAILAGEIDPATMSWQKFKSSFDSDDWDDDWGEPMATEAMKLVKAAWAYRRGTEKLNNISQNFTSGLSDMDRQALTQYGLDHANIIQQMNVGEGNLTTDKHWVARDSGYLNPYGQHTTLQFQGQQGAQSLQDVIKNYGITQPTFTRESTMTPEQKIQLRALQQLSSRSGQ